MILYQNAIGPTPDILKPAEADLLRQTSGAEVIWCGRGATALCWAYEAARRLRTVGAPAEIIMPAICCSVPANAALSVGIQPRFADCDPETGMVTVESVAACYTPSTCAVVFVHLFGQTADLEPLADWCHGKGVVLIEDAAQAQGAVLPDGQPVGSVGACCVYSFNESKILECGGGALLVQDAPLWEAVRETAQTGLLRAELSPAEAAIHEYSYRNTLNGLVGLCRQHPESIRAISEGFLHFRGLYDGLYRCSLQDPGALAQAWGQLPGILQRRKEKAEIYAERLDGGPWRLLNGWRQSGVCFRYSLLVDFPQRLVAFSDSIRRTGFHVSNLYWPVNQLVKPDDDCPRADALARAVVNLWVDDSVDAAWTGRCADALWESTDLLS